jgi:uncharacterized protein YuzE
MNQRARLANGGHAARQRRLDPAPAHRYLEVTYGEGKPLAAYLRFAPSSRATAIRSDDVGDGLSVDYDVDGNAIGIELTVPGAVTSDRLNELLMALGQAPLSTDHGPRWLDEHVFPRWSVAVDYLI